jgi:hypothetical protein
MKGPLSLLFELEEVERISDGWERSKISGL